MKQYKLLKDLPDAKAGTIFTHDGDDSYRYESLQYLDGISWYREVCVENNPEWFELVLPVSEPVKEKIYVTRLWQHDNFKGNGNDAFWYQFCTSKPIEYINNSKLKQAIENCINGDTVVEDKPVLHISDDGKEMKQGDREFTVYFDLW